MDTRKRIAAVAFAGMLALFGAACEQADTTSPAGDPTPADTPDTGTDDTGTDDTGTDDTGTDDS